VSSGDIPSVEGVPPIHGFFRSGLFVTALAAALVVALALLGFFVAACGLAVVALVVPRVSAGALNVRVLVWVLAGIVFLVPDRFEISGSLPIDLEPYRILFGLITMLWLVVLLTNPEARLHRTLVDLPLLLIFASILVSVVANPERANVFNQSITKALLLFTTYILLVYLICSVFDSFEDTRRFIAVLVTLGTVVAGCAVVESATAYNVFDEWLRVGWLTAIPQADVGEIGRGGATRALASASHPIPLGVLLAMLIPLAAYLAHRDRRWLVSVIVLPAGMLATVSRTPLIMLAVILLVLAFLRPAESIRLLAVLILGTAALLVSSPSSVEAAGEAFFPQGGILAEQSGSAGGNVVARGRLADLRPVFNDWVHEPIVGQGFGSRPVDGRENSLGDGRYSGVLDDQWLDLLLETGAVGVAAWGALFFLLIRGLRERAKVPDDVGMLCVALLASLLAFVVAMFFLDAFGFPQLVFFAFVVIAVAANVLRLAHEEDAIEQAQARFVAEALA
jgi:O-antigen ligase